MPTPSLPPHAAIELGHRVRERRNALGLSQERLTEGTALHWSFIGRIERGRANLTLRNILRLSEALDMDPGDLLRGLQADQD